ncbi:phenylalanine 4-monooxygenase [Streptoalloteichus tenebrarius]|uniref:phenylalanine 4-monooxygenase n=1 Tax=Streptoalloteichus tenebrarius (strain ATCC 17920 / DSM 40477 / JCM 4838 / CBS 697.72 / NBRC 16177 / NCIMB 11028 / NRRL B-12390 / A12253. 1 / ISP 5477) TaxID=1933 RepID=UPI0020A29D53|nr:phenylalanine 4-monooxygenase [Streptoalloteichus tenebrarius]BFF04282.1 hypothetical protein GCM10020241_59570 [Streptoalloteichus tenebrarius]
MRTPVAVDGRLGPASRHPGMADPAYLARRRALGELARDHRVGDPAPTVTYSDAEHRMWGLVHRTLVRVQRRHACRAIADVIEAVDIPDDHVPQHAEVNSRLQRLTGFRFTLTGGLVDSRRLYGAMADGYFHGVQYLRHPAVPFYTPEPDALHDLVGHGTQLAAPRFAELYRVIGRAVHRVETAEAVSLIDRLFWFTVEYGVVRENGDLKAYGAALLSSYGEIECFRDAEIRPLDLRAMANTPYQINGYQPILYRAESLDHLTDTLGEFFDEMDDDTPVRLCHWPGTRD